MCGNTYKTINKDKVKILIVICLVWLGLKVRKAFRSVNTILKSEKVVLGRERMI